jgi:hypothetical protein
MMLTLRFSISSPPERILGTEENSKFHIYRAITVGNPLILRLAAIPGLSDRIFKNTAKTRETLLFQPVGAQALSIAVSSF